ncbi:MAG: tetratricopeptide repeat protein [Janthinobacterium lividum]
MATLHRMKMRGYPRLTPVLVMVLIAIYLVSMAASVHRESVTWDEGDHLFAGFMSLDTGDFGLNPEHPPMAKMVAALPLLPLHLRVPPLQGRFFKGEAYRDGRDLLFGNLPRYAGPDLLFRARLAMLLFPLSLALLVFFAGRELFGTATGLLALCLLAFEPNLLTHGPLITTDMAISATFMATVWAAYRYAVCPTFPRLAVAGLAAGLALAAKHSGLVLLVALLPLLAGEAVLRAWGRRRSRNSAADFRTTRRDALHLLGGLIGMVGIALLVLWAFYGFRYAARPAGLGLSPDLAHYVVPLRSIEAGGILLLARLHVFPESWLYGLADVRLVANATPTYFFGKVYAHGLWLYFPAVLLIKLTLGSLALLAIALFAAARGWLNQPRELWFVLFPMALYFLIASGSGLNIGVRHILPCIPLLLLFAAAGAVAAARRGRGWAIAVAVLLCAHVASSAWAFPLYLPYANEAWGGSARLPQLLSDSNVDWGQQLPQVAQWVRINRAEESCHFAYFVTPFILPSDYGIPCTLLPTFDSAAEQDIDVPATVNGVLLISQGDLNGFEFGTKVRNPYEPLVSRKPDAVIDHGVFVFRGSFYLPDAAAMAPTQRATRALAAGDARMAVTEAQKALAISPSNFDALVIAGKALAAQQQTGLAADAFHAALHRVDAMEPSAQALWRPQIEQQLRSLPNH